MIVRKLYQKYVDMGLKLEENMYGWVGFFIFGPHTPITFLVKYPPPRISLYWRIIVKLNHSIWHFRARWPVRDRSLL